MQGQRPPTAMPHREGVLQGVASTSWDWPRSLAARGSGPLQAQHLQRKPADIVNTPLYCYVLDCSASMRQSGALAAAKGWLLARLEAAYQQRAHAALLCFSGQGVQLHLAPQRPPAWNDAWLEPIGGGGHSPLAQALAQADQLLRQATRYAPAARTLCLLSDGRVPHWPARPVHAGHLALLDCERSRIPLARMQRMAEQWQCSYQHLDRNVTVNLDSAPDTNNERALANRFPPTGLAPRFHGDAMT